jgi:hypothetical protein
MNKNAMIDELVLKVVSKAVNEFDPLGLLAGGAPSDEFESEIKEIALFLTENVDCSQVALAAAIQNVFRNSFGSYNSDCMPVAQSIFDARIILNEILHLNIPRF